MLIFFVCFLFLAALFRYCVEYDLANTSLTTGILPVKFLSPSLQSYSAVRLEKTAAKPSCVMWCPKYEDDIEDK